MPLFTTKTATEKSSDIAPQVTTGNGQAPASAITPTPESLKPVLQGAFKGLRAKQAEGRATLLKIGEKYILRLEDDFSVTNGPDLYVGFGNDGKVDSDKALIAKLKANSGGQNYEIPSNIDPTKYSQVFIHCRAFAYSFGVANLTTP